MRAIEVPDEEPDKIDKRFNKQANKAIIPDSQVVPIISLKKEKGKNYNTLPTPNFNQVKNKNLEQKNKFKTFKFKKSGKKIQLDQKPFEMPRKKENPPIAEKEEYYKGTAPTLKTSKISHPKPEIENSKNPKKPIDCKNRYGPSENTETPVKFNGFGIEDDIIINPEFNKSLKESLKQSKRRLMLFIDNNEAVNPVKEKPKLARVFSNASVTGNLVLYYFIDQEMRRRSLGLRNSEVER